ncbi:MAG: hypothetical protein NC238_06260 [Dehalobacter sp.]|nr:hypothetical protein [Dehalobacter sp.]
MKKLLIIDIFRQGFNLYKKNFEILFTISFFIALINIFNILPQFLYQLLNEPIFILLEYVVSLIAAFLNVRFGICLIIVIWELIHNRRINIEKAYQQSSKYFWRSIGNTILVGLTVVIPMLLLGLVNRSLLEVYYKYPLIAILSLIIALISTFFYFAPISVPLSPEIGNRLRYSMYLVKNNVIKVIIIIFVSTYLIHIPWYFIHSFGTISPAYFTLLSGSINVVINLVLLPFSMSVTVILYDKLIKLKDKKKSRK